MTHCYYIQTEIWGYLVQSRTSLTHCKWPQFSIRLNSLIQVIWPKLGKGGLRNKKWTYAWNCGTLQSSSVILIRQFTKVNWVNYSPKKTHIFQQSWALNLYLPSSIDKMITVLFFSFHPVSSCCASSSKTRWLSSQWICVQCMYACVNPDVMFSQTSALLTLRI